MKKTKCAFYREKQLFVRLGFVMLIMVLTTGLLSQAASAQTTYVITDGDKVLVHTTYATDPQAVLEEAGLALRDEDTFTAQADGDVSEITVTRMQMVHVHHGEEVLEVGTYGATVEEILTQLNIAIDENLYVTPSLTEQTTDDMVIEVKHLEYKTEVYREEKPFETEYYTDESLPAGEEKILIEGQNGSVEYTAKVAYEKGKEVSRTVTETKTLKEPINEVVLQGVDRSVKEQEGKNRVYVPILSSMGFNSTTSPGDAGAVVSDDGSKFTTASGETVEYKRKLTVEATAYCKQGTTAVGTTARYGAIAVDPSVIPYGTEMYIVSNDGNYIYGYASAEDCGNFRGNAIDLFFDDEDFCWQFGRRDCTVYILG